MKNKLGDKVRLQHMLKAISEINEYVLSSETFEQFRSNSMLVHACISQFEILGEAASRISDELKNSDSEIDWKDIVAFRNLLIHEYFRVDEMFLWDSIQTDLPYLESKLEALLALQKDRD